MRNNGQSLVAREGLPILLILLALVILGKLYLGWIFFLVFIILFLIALYIFRNPPRIVPSSPLAVVSPCSGKLLSVETLTEHWLSTKVLKLTLTTGFWDTHALVSPIEGKVLNSWAEDIELPEFDRRHTYYIQTDEGDNVLISLLLGKWSPFTRIFMQSGERVGQGQYCGFLYWRGNVEIYIPPTSHIDIKVGDRMRSGSDILGRLVHTNGESAITP